MKPSAIVLAGLLLACLNAPEAQEIKARPKGSTSQAVKVIFSLSIDGPRVNGVAEVPRDTLSRLSLHFAGQPGEAKARVIHTPQPRPGSAMAGRPRVVHEAKIYLKAALGGRYEADFQFPLTLSNGLYEVEAEVAGVGTSARTRVRLIDPPVRIHGLSAPSDVGGKLTLRLNRMPAAGRVMVTRTQNAKFPEEWWAPHKSVGAKSTSQKPVLTTNNGALKAEITMPVSMGAGHFQVRVTGKTANDASAHETFAFKFKKPAAPMYHLRIDSIECLVETDEVGDDEIYAITLVGQAVNKSSPAQPFIRTGVFGPYGIAAEGVASVMTELLKVSDLKPRETLWAVCLFENDDGVPNGFEYELRGGGGRWKNILTEPIQRTSVGGVIVDIVRRELEKQDRFTSNNDEYLGWKNIPLSDEDLVQARKVKGWRPRSVEIEGDGGKYRLTFSVAAFPKTA